MKEILKKIGYILIIIIGIIFVVGIAASISTTNRLQKPYDISSEHVEIPTDNASIEEGKRLASIYCIECHDQNLAGKNYSDDPSVVFLDTANLTAGEGGVGSFYTNEDWVRAIRHGVNPDGRALFVMPSQYFYNFSDEDLGQIIAYLKSAPSENRTAQETTYGFLGKVLIGLGLFEDVISAEVIDHDGPRPIAPDAEGSVEFGNYLVDTFRCKSCHGESLSGLPPQMPGSPPAPNLTRGGYMKNFSADIFIQIIRARKSDFMPFEFITNMNDEELESIWLYLESLPAIEEDN